MPKGTGILGTSAMQLCKVLQTIFLTVLKAGDRNSLQGPKKR